jgi:hypothetical protein
VGVLAVTVHAGVAAAGAAQAMAGLRDDVNVVLFGGNRDARARGLARARAPWTRLIASPVSSSPVPVDTRAEAEPEYLDYDQRHPGVEWTNLDAGQD